MTRKALQLAVVCGTALALQPPLLADHPTHPEGYAAEKAYEVGLVDNVDLFSGALGLTLPIGPLTLTYNSNVWKYETVDLFFIRANPYRKLNAGLGWRLSFGEVYHKHHWSNDTGRWLFVDETGGTHIFNANLHRGEDDGGEDISYSRDNSYLRFKEFNKTLVEIEFPDGTTRRYAKPAEGEHNLLRFTKQWNRFGSAEDPDLEVTYSWDDEEDEMLWTVEDRYGRTHYVHFDTAVPRLDDAVTKVDLESYQGQRKVYTFSYVEEHIWRSCKDTDPESPQSVQVPILTEIGLPDGTSYRMEEDGTLLYEQTCAGQLDELPGVLNGVVLPTGGKFAWDYGLYEYPDPDPIWSDNTGVASKTMKAADDTVLGVWTYENDPDPPQGDHPEVRTEVVYPTGDCVKHHFNARWWLSNGPKRGWEYGLPLAYSQEDNGFYLSREIWDSSSGESCDGTKLRSVYVKYDRDELPDGTVQPEWWFNSNRRLVGTRTVFHDDEDRWKQTEYAQFDGLGHFREVKTTGNFWDGSSNNEERITYTNYDRVSGVYPDPSYEPPEVTDPWVLEIYDYVETTEDDAVGETVAKVEYGFDSDTGALTCERTLESGSARDADDVLVTYTHDFLGRVTDLKTYGGDLQALPTGGADCGNSPAEPEYWVTRVRQS